MLDGVFEGGDRRGQIAAAALDLAPHQQRAGQDRLVAQLEGQVVGRLDVGPGLGDGPPLRRHRRSTQQQVGPPAGRLGTEQAQGLAVETLGHGQGLRHLGPTGGLLEPVEG